MARGRGGQRTGTPGKSYSNRTDLNEPASAEVYGDRKASQERLEAVPIQRASPPGGQQRGAPRQGPAAPMPINRPSERPMEPVQAGLPTGPGPGPEALGMASRPEMELRSIYQQTGNEAIRELIEALEEGR